MPINSGPKFFKLSTTQENTASSSSQNVPKEGSNTRQLAAKFLDKVIDYSKLDLKTSPILMKHLLHLLKLDDLETKDEAFNLFIKKLTSERLDLTQLINAFKEYALNNEGVCTLLAYIEDNQLISQEEIKQAEDTLLVQLHLLCLLESFVATLSNSSQFAEDTFKHILNQRNNPFNKGNTWTNFLFGTPWDTPLFERLKLISIEPGFLQILFQRQMSDKLKITEEDVKQFIEKYHLSSWNASSIIVPNTDERPISIAPMAINIIEACRTDVVSLRYEERGGKENSKSGLGLIGLMEQLNYRTAATHKKHILPEGVEERMQHTDDYPLIPGLTINSDPKVVSEFKIDKFWQDLYVSWNARFVISNIDYSFLIFKLMVPSVLGAEAHNFKETRLLALFFIGNLYLSVAPQNDSLFKIGYRLKNADEILKQWGVINQEWASLLLKERTTDSEVMPDKAYEKIIGNYPTLSMLRQLTLFSQDPEAYRMLVKGTTAEREVDEQEKPKTSKQKVDKQQETKTGKQGVEEQERTSSGKEERVFLKPQ
ncbi:symporter [Legionella sp. 227]|uniref:symporter n=1 Tax=Legionella sp. 227 TaxID=3367288 RepID=UPI00370D0ADE